MREFRVFLFPDLPIDHPLNSMNTVSLHYYVNRSGIWVESLFHWQRHLICWSLSDWTRLSSMYVVSEFFSRIVFKTLFTKKIRNDFICLISYDSFPVEDHLTVITATCSSEEFSLSWWFFSGKRDLSLLSSRLLNDCPWVIQYICWEECLVTPETDIAIHTTRVSFPSDISFQHNNDFVMCFFLLILLHDRQKFSKAHLIRISALIPKIVKRHTRRLRTDQKRTQFKHWFCFDLKTWDYGGWLPKRVSSRYHHIMKIRVSSFDSKENLFINFKRVSVAKLVIKSPFFFSLIIA